jgi:predicted DNA-binding protein (MmcQ/YjbR family)
MIADSYALVVRALPRKDRDALPWTRSQPPSG